MELFQALVILATQVSCFHQPKSIDTNSLFYFSSFYNNYKPERFKGRLNYNLFTWTSLKDLF